MNPTPVEIFVPQLDTFTLYYILPRKQKLICVPIKLDSFQLFGIRLKAILIETPNYDISNFVFFFFFKSIDRSIVNFPINKINCFPSSYQKLMYDIAIFVSLLDIASILLSKAKQNKDK